VRGTHFLETGEGGTCNDMERKRPNEGHSPSGEGRGRYVSGQGEKRPNEEHSPTGDGRGRDLSGHKRKRLRERHSLSGDSRGDFIRHRKKAIKRNALTFWRQQKERFVRTSKKRDSARGIHQLETGEGEICMGTERKRPSEGHSPTVDGRGWDLSGHGKKVTE
jgi:hypothetical protein